MGWGMRSRSKGGGGTRSHPCVGLRMCQPRGHRSRCDASAPRCISGIPAGARGSSAPGGAAAFGEAHPAHRLLWVRGPCPRAKPRAGGGCIFQARVFAGFGSAASVRAEQRNDRL